MATSKKALAKVTGEQIKDLSAQGAKSIIEFFLGNESVRKAYIKVLRESGMTVADVCKAAHTSPQTVKEIMEGRDVQLEDGMVETLKSIELNKLYMITGKILETVEGKIEGMKGGDLAYAYKTFMESRRLLENKSTGNISILISVLTKKFEEEGNKINLLMKGIARKDPNVELQDSG